MNLKLLLGSTFLQLSKERSSAVAKMLDEKYVLIRPVYQ